MSNQLASLFRGVSRRARGSLRAKFILAIASLIIALMAAVTFVVDRHQRDALLGQARLRALTLAKGLVSVSEGYLLSYNFVQLEQLVEDVQSDEEDVVYAVVHGRDGRVAVYSGRSDLHGKMLDDAGGVPAERRFVEVRGRVRRERRVHGSGLVNFGGFRWATGPVCITIISR